MTGPGRSYLRAIVREKIDVIVAGALEKEVFNSISRQRRAPSRARSAVLGHLFTKPAVKPTPLRRIVSLRIIRSRIAGLKRTLPLAAAESCERLYVIRIITR